MVLLEMQRLALNQLSRQDLALVVGDGLNPLAVPQPKEIRLALIGHTKV